jgi:signal peptidase I
VAEGFLGPGSVLTAKAAGRESGFLRLVSRCDGNGLATYGIKLDYQAMQRAYYPDKCFPRVSEASISKHRSFFASRYWLRDVILSVLLAFIIGYFFYQPVQVEGTSMLPELKDHERIAVSRFAYHFESIQRGDIIVFHYPLDPAESFVKRVIGLPGDWVSIKGGQVFVNGKRLTEPYIQPAYFDRETYAPVHVPPDHYYVLGDRRNFSNDSRDWGTVPRKYIYGKAVFAYWPLSDLGLLH